MVAMMQSIVLLLVGFVLLIKGADFFVEGSSSVARALRIPSMIVGLTIVAMGTSLPELAVSVTASVAGNNALAVSNVIGSNLFNLMLVCGACALFAPLIVQKDTLKKRNTSFRSVCGAFVCSGNFRHGDRKNRWCDIVTSFYWIFGLDGTICIKSACGIGRSRRSFR